MYSTGRYVVDLDVSLASKYYFQMQSNSDEDVHYRTIYAMLFFLELLSSLLYAFLCLTTYTWIFPALLKSEKEIKQAISPKFIKFTTLNQLKGPHYVAKGITAAIAILPLVGFHIAAVVELVKHREEVLHDQDVPAPSTIAVFFTLSITTTYLIIFYIVYRYNRKEFKAKEYIMHCLTSLTAAYIGHFIPFISLAFIQDPLKTFLIGVGEFMVVACVYGVVLVSLYSIRYRSFRVFLDALGWILSAVLVVAAMVTILTLFSIGSFNDFDDIQELLFPIIGTVGTLLIGYYLKPSVKEDDKQAIAQNQGYSAHTGSATESTADSQV